MTYGPDTYLAPLSAHECGKTDGRCRSKPFLNIIIIIIMIIDRNVIFFFGRYLIL